MTSTTITDAIDLIGTINAAIAIIAQENLFFTLSIFCFIISFGIRLGNDKRIEKYLQGIRDKVRK